MSMDDTRDENQIDRDDIVAAQIADLDPAQFPADAYKWARVIRDHLATQDGVKVTGSGCGFGEADCSFSLMKKIAKPDDKSTIDEETVLRKLLATPPQPKAKPKDGASSKRRGRPPAKPKE